jgi:molybdopterin-binding protein
MRRWTPGGRRIRRKAGRVPFAPEPSQEVHPVKISARNQFKGKVVDVQKGATTAHVRIEIGGQTITASITNQAVDELGLAPGKAAIAVIKASDVLVAVE